MSRGAGQIQRAILQELDAATEPVTAENLRWKLWEKLDVGDGDLERRLIDGRLPTKWNTSFMRAVESLTNRSKPSIAVVKRRLSTFDELVLHYPGKTLICAARSLRLKLLPVLGKWARENAPRYSPGRNEQFHLKDLPPTEARFLEQSWRSIVPSLISLLPSLDNNKQRLLFLVVAKGKSLFETNEVKCGKSFAELLKPCVDAAILPPEIREQVTAFSQALLPPEETEFLRLKSYVHALANVPSHRRCTLKAETIDILDRAVPDVVRSLEGYEPPQPPSPPRRLLRDVAPVRHSPQLHHLIDQSVFQKFKFLSRA